MAELYRYAAFISYSNKEAAFARRLHRVLESYRIPASLGNFDLIGNAKPNRIYPIFRDREELPTGQLGELIEASLAASAKLIVVCSPNAAKSRWVQREIEYFCSLGRVDGVHAIIAADVDEATTTADAFPEALRNGALSLVAADARKAKDGIRNAWLKLVAGLVGVTPGQLIDRDKKRRAQRSLAWSAAAAAIVTFAVATTITIDVRNTRSDLTSKADRLVGEGLSIEALPFALAGSPAEGDVVSSAHPRADRSLRATGARAGMVAEVDSYSVANSNDGRFLAWQDQTSNGFLRDLRGFHAPTDLGSATDIVFSPDNRFVLVAQGGGNIELRPLYNDLTPIPLGRVARYQGVEFSSDGRRLIVRDGAGSTKLWDLQNLAAPRALGRVTAHFSPDGRYLLTYDSSGFGALRDLQTPAATPVDVGPLANEGDVFAFSSDGHYFVSRDGFGGGLLIHLRDPNREIYLGPVARFAFATNGAVLAFQERGFHTTIRHLDGSVGDVTLEDGAHLTLSGDGRFAAAVDHDRNGTLYDTTTGRVAKRLGAIELYPDFAFSRDGRFLAYRNAEQGGVLRDLRADTELPLGRVSSGGLEFSPNDRFLMIHSEGYFASLRDLSTGETIPVGPIGSFSFSGDGRILQTTPFEEERTIVRRLDAPLTATRGADLRAEICRLNANAMRPFRPSDRQPGGDGGNTYQSIRGRPWNPCDWRGLFAFENHWEGLRQWRRLIGVRYLHEPDYACGQTNAAGDISQPRREACARQEREPPELWRPTAHPAL